jgi:hypothetical protein
MVSRQVAAGACVTVGGAGMFVSTVVAVGGIAVGLGDGVVDGAGVSAAAQPVTSKVMSNRAAS